jgi:hypothetical protein
MSSNRLKYDSCAYATDIKESTQPLEYNLFLGKYETCKSCPVGDYGNILPFGPKTEVESELLGINRPATKCDSLKYNPKNKAPYLPLSAARMCDSIYYITPNNIEKPTSNDKTLFNTIDKVEKFTDTEMTPYEKYLRCRYDPAKKTADCMDKCKENDILCRRACVKSDVNAWQLCYKYNDDIKDRYDIGCIDNIYDICMKDDDTNSSYSKFSKCLDDNNIKMCDILS